MSMGVLIIRLQHKLSFSCHLCISQSRLIHTVPHEQQVSRCLDDCPEDLRRFSRGPHVF